MPTVLLRRVAARWLNAFGAARCLGAISFCGVLSACALGSLSPQARLPDGVPFTLRSGAEAPGNIRWTLRLEQQREAELPPMTAVMDANPDNVALVGLGPLGHRLFALSWDGSELEYDAPAFPGDARRIAAELQLVLWPLDSLRRGLADSGVAIVESQGVRRVVRGDREVLRITYNAEFLSGDHLPWRAAVELPDGRGMVVTVLKREAI